MVALSYRSVSNGSYASAADHNDSERPNILSKLSQRRIYIPVAALLLLALLIASSGTTPAAVAQTASAAKEAILSYTPYISSTPKYGGIPYGPTDLEAAVANSEELWRKNVEKRDAFIQSKGGLKKMTPFEYKPKKHPAWTDAQMWIVWDVFGPSYTCPWPVERIGAMGDGGKWVCGVERVAQVKQEKCVIYSFGVFIESSFEAELLARTDCEIWAYDYSVRSFGPQIQALPEEVRSRAHFEQLGIGETDYYDDKEKAQFYTLASLMKSNGHDRIDILKMDIEGGEFKVLEQVIDEFGPGNLPFDQMQLEIHFEHTKPKNTMEAFHAWWTKLESAGLRASYSELNLASTFWLPYPTAIEFTFLNTCNGREDCGVLLRE